MDYEVKDYGIFTDAVNTTNTLINDLNEDKSSITKVKEVLSNGAVFMGPICDDCLEGISGTEVQISSAINSLTGSGTYLTTTSSAYQTADQAASQTIAEN